MPEFQTKFTTLLIAVALAGGINLINDCHNNEALAGTRVQPIVAGPYESERQAIRSWLLKAKKKGVGIKGYLNVYNDMENAVKQGQPEGKIKEKLDRINSSIGNQYVASTKLQSPRRKVPKHGYSQAQYRGKVDSTFGKNRYITPHEIKQSCEEAERQAWARIPRHLMNDLEVRQDLRRQRDLRERSLMRKHNFKERGFTRNPHRYRNYTIGGRQPTEAEKQIYRNRYSMPTYLQNSYRGGQRMGAGNYSTYKYGTR